jgi:hypothetical protein
MQFIGCGALQRIIGKIIMPDVGILMSVSALNSAGKTPPGVNDRMGAIEAGLAQQGHRPGSVAPPVFSRQLPWEKANYGTSAATVVGLAPGVIFSSCYPTMAALGNLTTTIPIIYAGLFNANAAQQFGTDPDAYYFMNVAKGASNNITGFVSHQFEVCEQWPALLALIAPTVTDAAVLYEAAGSGITQYDAVVKNARA